MLWNRTVNHAPVSKYSIQKRNESEIIKQIAEHQISNRCNEKGIKRPKNNTKMYLEKV
ncbi:hypothetical protein T01_1088 [Trichinella spiralis]|uniref:Uncharacterized protein n=1 Tax=Trichinella spiralis TaxID=6334 RepID=A0A0V0Z1U2_TRISP|nr:hypothetical protein T01_1088 [Trichinella spiralis]